MSLRCVMCRRWDKEVEFLFFKEPAGPSICSACIDTFTAELRQARQPKEQKA